MAYRCPYPDITVPDVDLMEQVFSNALKKPDAIAMADGLTGRTISYGQLLEQIRRTAAGLAARGIRKGTSSAVNMAPHRMTRQRSVAG